MRHGRDTAVWNNVVERRLRGLPGRPLREVLSRERVGGRVCDAIAQMTQWYFEQPLYEQLHSALARPQGVKRRTRGKGQPPRRRYGRREAGKFQGKEALNRGPINGPTQITRDEVNRTACH
jgi:hypothetical protein